MNFKSDLQKVEAAFDNGVLVIKIKLSKDGIAKTHDIKITQSS